MPQKIRSACLHDSRTWHISDLYPIIPHMNEARIRSRYNPNSMRFFPVYTVIEQIWSVSHMSKKSELGHI